MSIQRNVISTALMATALAVAAIPLMATAYHGAEAAGVSKERFGKPGKSSYAKRRQLRGKVVRKRNRRTVVRRAVRSMPRKLRQPKRVIRRARPAVTMPKRVINARPRPRPAVTMPKTVITGKPRPIARPAVTTPKTVITARPRPNARPAVTTPKTVITARPRPAVTTPKTVVGAQSRIDPTSGRINDRQQAANAAKQKQYQQCAAFSIRVMQGCYSQAQGDPQKQRSCRQHYQGNVVRCQGLL